MTNREWLEMLAHEAPDELAEWFDAEHDPGGAAGERLEPEARLRYGIIRDGVFLPNVKGDELRGMDAIVSVE